MKSVNFMSRQLLDDLNVKTRPEENEVAPYFRAIAAVTEPSIDMLDGDIKYEYQTNLNNDSNVLKDLKRIKRHDNVSKILNNEHLCIVPEGQIESIPGILDHE